MLVVSAVLPDGKKMASTRQTFANLAELPARIDSVGNALRKAFGESAALVRASKPLDEVTSKSLDAVRLYSQGREHLNVGDPRGAIPLLQRAIELDSDVRDGAQLPRHRLHQRPRHGERLAASAHRRVVRVARAGSGA